MNPLDFLTAPPNIFIFEKEHNKTSLGGILFLIFIIIMALISIIYIFTFIKNDKYLIEYSPVFYTSDMLMDLIKNQGEIYNPSFDLTINFSIIPEELSDKYLLYDIYDEKYIKGNYSEGEITFKVKKNILYFPFDIIYICENESCSEEVPPQTGYAYSISSQKYIIKSQDNIPIQMVDEERILAYDHQIFTPFYYLYSFNPIIYSEASGGFSNFFDSNAKKIYSNGDYEFEKRDDIFLDTYQRDNLNIKVIITFELAGIGTIAEFKRTKIEFMDVIVKIGSLFMTIKSIFSVLLIFYSNNYSNYKIIQKIINIKNNKVQNIELSNNIHINNEIQNISNENNNIEVPLIKESQESKNSDQNDNLNINEKDTDSIEENNILPKLSFFDFYFNNLYFKICKRNKKQEMINICNKIIFKYFSADFIIANLIKLENLFKDYRWNNPELNNIQNNYLINQLKEIK